MIFGLFGFHEGLGFGIFLIHLELSSLLNELELLLKLLLGLHFINNYNSNEDGFWSKHAKRINPAFNVAPVAAEIAFAFEKEPQQLYQKNNGQLPFGCHAWEKYDLNFWKPIIEAHGYKLV